MNSSSSITTTTMTTSSSATLPVFSSTNTSSLLPLPLPTPTNSHHLYAALYNHFPNVSPEDVNNEFGKTILDISNSNDDTSGLMIEKYDNASLLNDLSSSSSSHADDNSTSIHKVENETSVNQYKSWSKSSGNNRIKRTCEGCSKAKVKCSSSFPRCTRCDQRNMDCIYIEEKKRGRKGSPPFARLNEIIKKTFPGERPSKRPASDTTSPASSMITTSSSPSPCSIANSSYIEILNPNQTNTQLKDERAMKRSSVSSKGNKRGINETEDTYNELQDIALLLTSTDPLSPIHGNNNINGNNINNNNDVGRLNSKRILVDIQTPSVNKITQPRDSVIDDYIRLANSRNTTALSLNNNTENQLNASGSLMTSSSFGDYSQYHIAGERIFAIFFVLFKHLSSSNPSCPCHDQNGAFSGSPFILNLHRMGKFLQRDNVQASPITQNRASLDLSIAQATKNREIFVMQNNVQNYEKYVGSLGPKTEELLGILQTGIIHDASGTRVLGNPDFSNSYTIALSDNLATVRMQVSVGDVPYVTTNMFFTSMLGYTQTDLVSFFTDYLSGGLLPWGTDILALLMENADDVLDFVHRLSVGFNRIIGNGSSHFREAWYESTYRLRGKNGFNQLCRIRYIARELVSFGGTAFEVLLQVVPIIAKSSPGFSESRLVYPNQLPNHS